MVGWLPQSRARAATADRRQLALWLLAALAVVLAAAWQFLIFAGFPNDHYVHVARAYQMLQGGWPVRDFVDPGMPLMYVASALGRMAFGDRVASEFSVVAAGFAVGAAATAICASALARSVLIAAGVVLLEIVASPRSYSYPKILIYGLAGCAIVALASRPSAKRILAAAGLTVIAFLFRHDHGLYVGAACVTVLLVASGSDWRVMWRRIRTFAVAVIAALAPWAVYVQLYGGLIPYFASGIEFSRREAEVTRLRDWPTFDFAADALMSANAAPSLFYLFHALPFLCLVIVWWRRRSGQERWNGEFAAVCGVAVMAAAVNSGFLRDPVELRLADAVVPMCLLGAWLIALAWSAGPVASAGGIAWRGFATLLFAATTIAIAYLGGFTESINRAGLEAGRPAVVRHVRSVARELRQREIDARSSPSRVSRALVPFMRYVRRCTAPGDRLLVSGQYPDVFVLADRGFAGGHVAFMNGYYSSELEQNRMLQRIVSESVPFVLLVVDAQEDFERNFPLPLEHIVKSYRLLAHIPVPDMQGIQILVERGRQPERLDLETGWPCFQ